MGFTEKISMIIDTDASGGVGGLKGFRNAVSEADGFTGKLKAGVGNLGDQLKANAGPAALAAGAALVTFGIKAVGAFTETATAARDFAAATGLGVEDASRWIAIADDVGLSAGDLQAAFGMVSKSLDSDKWDKYGIATRDAGGNARDMNDIMLDTFDVLSKETNLTERARLGKELLGKGYADMAPMIGKSRDEYEKMLGSVEKGQVINEEEAKKAQKMKEAQDALGDALGEITLAFGGVVAGLSPLIELLADGVGVVAKFTDGVGYAVGEMQTMFDSGATGGISAFKHLYENIDYASVSLEQINEGAKNYNLTADETNQLVVKWAEVNGVAQESTDGLADSTALTAREMYGLSGDTRKAKEAMEGVATAANEADREFSELKGEIDDEQAWLDMLDTLDDYEAKQNDATVSDRDKERSSLAVKEALIEQLQAIEGLPAEKRTEILTMIDQGQFDAAAWSIGVLTADRKVKIGFDVGNMPSLPGQKYASGTNSAAPGVALVGEQGPELVMMGGGETVLTAGQTRTALAGGNTYVTIHVPQLDPRAIEAALTQWRKRNGRG